MLLTVISIDASGPCVGIFRASCVKIRIEYKNLKLLQSLCIISKICFKSKEHTARGEDIFSSVSNMRLVAELDTPPTVESLRGFVGTRRLDGS